MPATSEGRPRRVLPPASMHRWTRCAPTSTLLNVDPGLDTFRSERADLRRAGVPLGGAQLVAFVGSIGADRRSAAGNRRTSGSTGSMRRASIRRTASATLGTADAWHCLHRRRAAFWLRRAGLR